MSLFFILVILVSLGIIVEVDTPTLGCRLSLASFAFRFAFRFLLLLGSLGRSVSVSGFPFGFGISLLRSRASRCLIEKTVDAVRGWAYWQLSPFLHPSGLRKNRHTGLSDAGALLGLGLVVGIAVFADRGCCARSTCWSTWSSRARALAKTTNLRHASWRFAMVTSSLSPLSRKIATHSVIKMLSEVWRGFSHIHKDCHSSSGFDVRCHFISDHQLGHPILKPCCELEHTDWHLCWQCV